MVKEGLVFRKTLYFWTQHVFDLVRLCQTFAKSTVRCLKQIKPQEALSLFKFRVAATASI